MMKSRIMMTVVFLALFFTPTIINADVKDSFKERVIATVINMPSWDVQYKKESPEQRAKRLALIVDAVFLEIDSVKGFRNRSWFWSRDDLVWSTINTMWWESARFDVDVHRGTRRGDRGRSVCLGQIMRGGEELVGTDMASTRRCVRMTMRHLITHQHRCLKKRHEVSRYTMAKIYAGYVTGWSCSAAFKMKVKRNGKVVKRVPIAWNRAEMFWKLKHAK